MPMSVVEAAFQARYLAYTGDSPPSIPAILSAMPSPNHQAFVVMQFPVVNGSQPVLERHFFEEGAARIVLNVRRSFSMEDALTIADNIAQIFRRRKFDGIETFTPSAPIINEAANDGNWFELAVVVPYRYQFYDLT